MFAFAFAFFATSAELFRVTKDIFFKQTAELSLTWISAGIKICQRRRGNQIQAEVFA